MQSNKADREKIQPPDCKMRATLSRYLVRGIALNAGLFTQFFIKLSIRYKLFS